MERTETLSRVGVGILLALAAFACAALLAVSTVMPAYAEEEVAEAEAQEDVPTVFVQFSNVERADGDYDKYKFPIDYSVYPAGDTGGSIMWLQAGGAIFVPSQRLEEGFTISGQGHKASEHWIVVDKAADGRYASSVAGVFTDTNGNGESDHLEIVATYPETYTPTVFNEEGDVIPVTKVTCQYDSGFTQFSGITWDASLENVYKLLAQDEYSHQKWPDSYPSTGLPLWVKDNHDLIVTSDNLGMVASSVEFTVTYNPILNLVTDIESVSVTYEPKKEDPTNKPVEVPVVSGGSGITAGGTLSGTSVPADAKVELRATMLTEGESYEALTGGIGNDMLYGVYQVDLLINGGQVHDGFGLFELTFPVDEKYNGCWITVLHRHNDGKITSERVLAEDGKITIKVSDLSSFALIIGEKANEGGQTGDSSATVGEDAPTKLPTTEAVALKTDNGAATLASTGDSPVALIALAVAGIGVAALTVARRKVFDK